MYQSFIFILTNLIVYISSTTNFVQAELKLTQVQVLFRHGERTPLLHEMYPNDIHPVSAYQPWGVGQLTNLGKLREYHIGQVLKTKYEKLLLGTVFNASKIWAVSSDTERTKMSLELVLAGIIPPSEELTWNSELPWIPIPFSYVPAPIDNLLKTHFCPQYNEALAKVRQTPEVREKTEPFNELLNFMSIKTGQNLPTSQEAYQVYNLLVCQKALNLSMPEWCTEEIFEQMGEMTALEYQIASYTTELKRLLGGPLVKRFIQNMWLNKSEENHRKMYLYSAHETTIASFLYAQGISDLKLPLYGTAVMFEKHEDEEGRIFVKIVLWTGVTQQLKTLRLPECEEFCPIETYLRLTQDVIPSQEELNCHWKRLSTQQIKNIFEGENVYD